MLAVTLAGQVRDLFRWTLGLQLARLVMIASNRVGIADVDVVVPEGNAKRFIQPFGESRSLVGDSVLVRITQDDDLASHRVGHPNVTIGRQRQPARPSKSTFRVAADCEARRHGQFCPGRLRNYVWSIVDVVLDLRRRQIGRLDFIVTRRRCARRH